MGEEATPRLFVSGILHFKLEGLVFKAVSQRGVRLSRQGSRLAGEPEDSRAELWATLNSVPTPSTLRRACFQKILAMRGIYRRW